LVLPELGLGLGATATLRLPEERIMALVEPQVESMLKSAPIFQEFSMGSRSLWSKWDVY
jgi:hypothetical protein